jgi:hypothetical protein
MATCINQNYWMKRQFFSVTLPKEQYKLLPSFASIIIHPKLCFLKILQNISEKLLSLLKKN